MSDAPSSAGSAAAAQAFDAIVIGAGPGGYVCAIRLAQLGFRVGVVEARATLGGTCLNIGCIPSKALLSASHAFEVAGHGLAAMGVKTTGVSLDLPAMMAHKDKVVKANVDGVAYLFRKNKITHLHGKGRILAPGRVQVTAADGSVTEATAAKAIIIATGSDVAPLPGVSVDEKRVVSSTGALALETVPEHLVVIGGGYIGLELGTVWHRLGSKVTVVEYAPRLLPGMDAEIAAEALKLVRKQGLVTELATKVTAVTPGADSAAPLQVTVEPAAGGESRQITADVLLLAAGRRPYTEGLGLAEVGIVTDRRGFIETDAHFATAVPGIYAIGDCTLGPMLAHKAEEEGVVLAEQLAGQKPHLNYALIPGIVYTYPEIATIGLTEEQAKEAGYTVKIGKFPFMANGRARAMNETDGLVKIIADAASDRILGAHIIGPEAGTLIHEIAVGMEFGASAEDIARTCHGHPTLNEAVKEAALAVDKRPLHL